MPQQELTRHEFEQGFERTADLAASQAAETAGAPLICYGIVLRDRDGQLCWFNRAHRHFATQIAAVSASGAKTVAFVGITDRGDGCFDISSGRYAHEEEVRSFTKALVFTGVLQKDSLFFARMSRSELAKRVASGQVTDAKLIADAHLVPQHVEAVYVYDTAQGICLRWEEPSAPPLMN